MEDIIEEEPTVQDDVPEDLVRKSRSYHFSLLLFREK